MATTGLSQQDIKDLQEISTHLQAGDPRQKKISILLNAAPTQFEQDRNPDNQSGGFKALASDVWGMAKNAISTGAQVAMQGPQGVAANQAIGLAQSEAQNDTNRKAAGYGVPYRVAAPVASLAGANVPAMEQAADVGNSAAIYGHAAAAAAPYVVGAGADVVKAPVEVIKGKLAGVAPDLYRSALKPSTVPKMQARVQAGIQTGLDYGIPVSEAGVEKLSGLIDDTNQKIAAAIQSDPTRPISANRVASRADQVRSRFQNQVNPQSDLAAIDSAQQEFLDNNPGPIPAEQAQAMKQGTYQQLKGKAYGELKTASVEAQKGLARGLKEELSNAFPELKDLNEQDSKFYSFDPILERAVARISNHQLIGIGTPAAGMAAKAATGSGAAAAVAGVVKAIVDNPSVKSRLAIMINKASKGQVTVPQAILRVGAYSEALSQASASGNAQPDENQASQ